MRMFTILAAGLMCLVLVLVTMKLMYPLPDNPGSTNAPRQSSPKQTTLARFVETAASLHPGMTGIRGLADGREALATRVVLARAAEHSIDAQYYIWQSDTTSWILLDELRLAAKRGVKVRLLVDDNGIPGLDRVLFALNKLENFEVRIFNPFTFRNPKVLNYLFDFRRLNRRMHNKSFTVDGSATIVGGRNIGDIYFAYGEGTHYFDLDVMALGPMSEAVSGNFERFWFSEPVYPAGAILSESTGGLDDLKHEANKARSSIKGTAYLKAIAESELLNQVALGKLALDWVEASMVSDDPIKGLGQAKPHQLMINRLVELLKAPERSLDLVSAYFVPGEQGTGILTQLAKKGVQVRVLTNALEATDVVPVHAAYSHYRKPLLQAGVRLLELKSHGQRSRSKDLSAILSGSVSSLHAKTFAIDGKRIFIGSFNFDPRSARLNTEMGILVESPKLAERLDVALNRTGYAYQVALKPDGTLTWSETDENGQLTQFSTEPRSSWTRRALTILIGWLPVEWMM